MVVSGLVHFLSSDIKWDFEIQVLKIYEALIDVVPRQLECHILFADGLGNRVLRVGPSSI